MLFKRKIYEEMIRWKESLKIKRKALLIKGLRQVGKTTIINEFTKEFYDEAIYLNFLDNQEFKEIFSSSLIANEIINKLKTFFTDKKFIPNKTVFVFDEVQECPNARYSVKQLMENSSFDVIMSGSLLGLRGYNKFKNKIPTGFETILYMYPMDFEEYLRAKKVPIESINYIKSCFANLTKVDTFLNNLFMNYFKEYLLVGGMPEAVSTYLESKDYRSSYSVLKNILEQYKDDFGKHLDENDNSVINKNLFGNIMAVYSSIPAQLSKENKKFTYNMLGKYASANKYLDSIMWLEEFGLIKLCYNLSALSLPLEGYKRSDCFKVFVTDTGLFMAMLGLESYQKIISNELTTYKGAIFENIVADALIKNNKNLYYFSKNGGLEIDFITLIDGEICALEVKSNDGRAKSLKEVLTNKNKYDVKKNYKLINGNVYNGELIKSIPLYMAFLIK